MRNILEVIKQLKQVIPEPIDFDPVLKSVAYTAPEAQSDCWARLAKLLKIHLGEPSGCPWKMEVARIMNGQ